MSESESQEVEEKPEVVEEKTVQGKSMVFYVSREALETAYEVTEFDGVIRLTVSPKGLAVRQMEPGHVALVDAYIRSRVKGLHQTLYLTLDRELLKQVFKVMDAFGEIGSAEKYVECKVTPSLKVRKYSDGRRERVLDHGELAVNDVVDAYKFIIEEKPHQCPIPKLKGLTRFTVDTSELKKAVKALMKVGEGICFEYSRRRWRLGVHKVQMGTSSRELPKSQRLFKGSPKNFNVSVNAELLYKLIFPSISKQATVRAKTKIPRVISHSSKGVSATAYLAPRLEQ